ncbi:MAG: hypothetical protein WAT65_03955, partial [Candidatus Nanopelagicales bacterium]
GPGGEAQGRKKTRGPQEALAAILECCLLVWRRFRVDQQQFRRRFRFERQLFLWWVVIRWLLVRRLRRELLGRFE